MPSPALHTRSRRRLISAVTLLLLVSAACSSDDGDQVGQPPAPGDADNGDGADIVVDFWHVFGGFRGEWVADTVDRYNEMTDGVTVVAEEKGNYNELLDAAFLAAGTDAAPAVAQVVVTSFGPALESGMFKSVSDADVEGKINPDDYLEAVMAQINIGGELISIPWANSTPILYYDKEMFEDAGLDPETPPATFDEIMNACEALVDQEEVVPTCIGIPWDPWFFENWVTSQDGVMINQGNGRDDLATEALIDSPEGLAVGQFYKDLHDRGYYEHATEGYEFPRQLFSESQAAMSLSSTADLGFYTDTFAEQGRQLGTGYYPRGSEEFVGTAIGGGSLWITDGLDPATEQAALDFILWMASAEISAEWHQVTGYLPVHGDAEDLLEQEGWFEENPNFKTAIDQLRDTVISPATRVPIHAAYVDVREEALDALEEIVAGHGDVTQALSDATQTATAAIERMNELQND